MDRDEELLQHTDRISGFIFQQNPEVLEALKDATGFLSENHSNISVAALNNALHRLDNVVMAAGPLIGSRILMFCAAMVDFGANANTVLDKVIFAVASIVCQLIDIHQENPNADVKALVQSNEQAKEAFSTMDTLFPAAAAVIASAENGVAKTQQWNKGALKRYTKFLRHKQPPTLRPLYALVNAPINRKILVIERPSKQAFEVRVNKVAFNGELMLLLKHYLSVFIPGMSPLRPQEVAALDGSGPPLPHNLIKNVWDLKHWTSLLHEKGQFESQDIEQDNNANSPSKALFHWIFPEECPQDIVEFPEIGPVVILDKTAYARSYPAERYFPLMKCSLEVERRLSDEEYSAILDRLCSAPQDLCEKAVKQIQQQQNKSSS